MIGDAYAMRQVLLERMKIALAKQVTVETATVMPTATIDWMFDRFVLEFRREVLANKLPPQHIRHVSMEPRFASAWDMWKAARRGRWWWPRFLSRVSYVDVPVVVNVVIRQHWMYPQAPAVPMSFGRAVLWTVVDDD